MITKLNTHHSNQIIFLILINLTALVLNLRILNLVGKIDKTLGYKIYIERFCKISNGLGAMIFFVVEGTQKYHTFKTFNVTK